MLKPNVMIGLVSILWTVACGQLDGGGADRPDACASRCSGVADAGAGVADAGSGSDSGSDSGESTPDAGPPDTAALTVCASGGDFERISDAIAAAAPNALILVCPGTYFERLVISKPLRIVSDDGASATIIDAESAGRAVFLSGVGAPGVLIEGFTIQNGASDGSGGGIHCASSTLTLRDIVVADSVAAEGAGMYANSCQLQIVGSRFEGSRADDCGGGALFENSAGSVLESSFAQNQAREGAGACVRRGTLTLADSQFVDNAAALRGGGLFHGASSVIEGSLFLNNESGWTGGGIHFDEEVPTLRDSQIIGNFSENDGGGIYVHRSEALISGNLFQSNVSNDDGGGIRLFESYSLVETNVVRANYAVDSGGGIRVSHLPCQFLNNSVLDNEAGGVGGGFDMDNDSSIVSGGVIAGNHAGGSGGGIHAWLFPWLGGAITDVVIADNSAWRGGGLYLRHNFQPIALRNLEVTNNTAAHGAGLVVSTTSFSLIHSGFRGNVAAAEGGAISIDPDDDPYEEECPCPPQQAIGSIQFVVAYDNDAAGGGSGLWSSSPSVAVGSSVFSDNAGTAVSITGAAPQWQYNDVHPASFSGMSDPTGSAGNLSSPPGFADPGASDFHLTAGSQCINAGDPGYIDQDGSRADMGMYGGLGGTQ